MKKEVAEKAADMVKSGMILGVGTGSTVAFFIDALGKRKDEDGLKLKAIVTTSNRSKKQLEGHSTSLYSRHHGSTTSLYKTDAPELKGRQEEIDQVSEVIKNNSSKNSATSSSSEDDQ